MENKKEIIKTIVIIILVIIIVGYFTNQWFDKRLSQERSVTLLQLQNEIYNVVKSNGQVNINRYENDGDGVKVVDSIILIEKIEKIEKIDE